MAFCVLIPRSFRLHGLGNEAGYSPASFEGKATYMSPAYAWHTVCILIVYTSILVVY